MRADQSNGHTGCSAEQRQQRAFREQLADDPSRRRSESEAEAHLTLSFVSPGQQQICDIRDDQQQEQSGHHGESPEQWKKQSLTAPWRLPHRNDPQR